MVEYSSPDSKFVQLSEETVLNDMQIRICNFLEILLIREILNDGFYKHIS